jgi:hypothetical protein
MPTVRTATHAYPAEELSVLRGFYGGKKCVVTRNTDSVQWAHILDAALDVSNPHVRYYHFCSIPQY